MNNQDDNSREEQIHKFLHSYDFMRLGQAINHNQWQAAAMNIQRMSRTAKELELSTFDRPFTGLRQAINRRDLESAKQALATVISKRVMMLKKDNN